VQDVVRLGIVGLRAGPVQIEIPSASLRAGSSLRLKNGSFQDDKAAGADASSTREGPWPLVLQFSRGQSL